MTMTTYGTPRVYVRAEGQYHEPLVRTFSTPDEAARWAADWNARNRAQKAA